MTLSERPTCVCARYATPLETLADVMTRYRVSLTISSTLDEIAARNDLRLRLLRCRICGKMWQESVDLMRRDALHQVPSVSSEVWLRDPYPNAALIAELRTALLELGPEVGPEPCAAPGCRRRRISHSVFCAKHHWLLNLKRQLPVGRDVPVEWRDDEA